MKKDSWRILAIVTSLVLATLLLVTACAKPAPAPAPAPSPAPAPAPAPAKEKPIELKFASFAPPMGSVHDRILMPWAKELEERSNGRVKLSFFWAGSLAPPPGLYDAVRTGTADMCWTDPGFTPGVFPREEIIALPMLFNSAEVAAAVYWDLMDKYMMDTDFKDVKVLWAQVLGAFQLFSRTKQVEKLEDLKGMKFAAQTPTLAGAIETIGGTPVFMPEPEIYTALDRGMVDGRFSEAECAVVFKSVEVTKYRTHNINLSVNKTFIPMNLDTWNSLPPDIQQIIDDTTGFEFTKTCGRIMDEQDKVFWGMITDYDKEAGNPPVYNLTDSERAKWVEAAAPMLDEWVKEKEAKGIPAKAMMEDLLALREKYSK